MSPSPPAAFARGAPLAGAADAADVAIVPTAMATSAAHTKAFICFPPINLAPLHRRAEQREANLARRSCQIDCEFLMAGAFIRYSGKQHSPRVQTARCYGC